MPRSMRFCGPQRRNPFGQPLREGMLQRSVNHTEGEGHVTSTTVADQGVGSNAVWQSLIQGLSSEDNVGEQMWPEVAF